MVANKNIVLTLALTLICFLASGNSIRRISTFEGLSNNSVFSLHQDHLGHLWIGTTDGLNIWDGHSLEMFNPDDGKNFFAGNTILSIHSDGKDGIWLRTYYGIAHINTITRQICYYDSLTFASYITCGTDGVPYVIGSDRFIYRLDEKSDSFIKSEIDIPNHKEYLKQMHRYGSDSLYCFTNKGIYLIKDLTLKKKIDTDIAFVSANPEGNICYFASNKTKDIFAFDMKTMQIRLYAEIGKSVPANEMYRALLPYKGSILVGFSVSGVYIAPPNSKNLTPTPIKQGIFPLLKDNRQDIVWVGTDGNGVINWQMNDLSFEEIRFSKLPVTVRMPIRSIMLDKKGTLWCGTKGDGIFTIRDFSPYMHLNDENVKKFTTSNSALTSNHVYSISQAHNDSGLWIGSDGPGINFYGYSGQKIRVVPGSESLTKVHVIYQQDENTLWISTHGRGVFKCRLEDAGSERPSITSIERITLPAPFTTHANIFSMYAPNDSTIYFGSRGSGVARLNTKSNEAQILETPADQGYASNDIYGMAQTDRMHFASGCGLLSYDQTCNRLETVDEIPSRATHAILSDEGDNLWISTNYGIICYDTQSRQTTTHNQHSGLYILEYADGAAYKDPQSDALFFGGVNGLTIIRNTSRNQADSVLYTPEINITHHISNNTRTLLHGDLKIPYSPNSFGIHFSVVDNTNYSDYEFSYRILGLDKEWKSNGNESTIHLPTLPPGKYTLEIRYHNNSNSYTSEPAQLQITIIPPVYATWWAKTLYILIVAGICAHYIRRFRTKYLNLKEELRISKALYGLDHSMIANMERIINDNLDNPELSVAFIADKMCISKQSLYRKLENAPDLKPQKLIREARMKAAAEMMKTSTLTIDEIMYKVGYDNRSTFYKNFKEQYGLTPKEYRQGKSEAE